jgi:hypothetical protein
MGANAMRTLRFGYGLSISVAAALLAGCGGSQPPIGAPGAMPQNPTIAAHAARGESWMLRANSGDLLYVSDAGTSGVYVFSYPEGRYVGKLNGLLAEPHYVCADQAGNVFVTEYGANNPIQEYAHGATSPFATLNAPGEPEECSVDPTTGNLAVAIYSPGSQPTGVAVYIGALGAPTLYTDSRFFEMTGCSYGAGGDLFVAGQNNKRRFKLAALPAGSSSFTDIRVRAAINGGINTRIQWDGQHLAIGSESGSYSSQYSIYRAEILGTRARVVGVTRLSSMFGYFNFDTAFFIRRHRIALTADFRPEGRALIWRYPGGGAHVEATGKFGSQYLDGVTVSVAPGR